MSINNDLFGLYDILMFRVSGYGAWGTLCCELENMCISPKAYHNTCDLFYIVVFS